MQTKDQLARSARRLAWIGWWWHWIEAGVGISLGISAGSLALIGFGLDSAVELVAGSVLLWSLRPGRPPMLEARGLRWLGGCWLLLGVYLVVEALARLTPAASAHTIVAPSRNGFGTAFSELYPQTVACAIVFTIACAITMYPLAWCKVRVARQLGSLVTASEARQTWVCAHLSLLSFVGLLLPGTIDSLCGLVIGLVCLREAQKGFRAVAGCCSISTPAPRADVWLQVYPSAISVPTRHAGVVMTAGAALWVIGVWWAPIGYFGLAILCAGIALWGWRLRNRPITPDAPHVLACAHH
jgi:hypothetical protein